MMNVMMAEVVMMLNGPVFNSQLGRVGSVLSEEGGSGFVVERFTVSEAAAVLLSASMTLSVTLYEPAVS